MEEDAVPTDTGSSEDEEEVEIDVIPEQEGGLESQTTNTRPRRANAGKGVIRLEPSMEGKSHQNTKVQFAQKGTANTEHQCEWFTKLKNIAVNACFTQMSARKGIEQFRKLTVAAMLKEYKQLDNLLVFGAVCPDSMSEHERKRALQAINLIMLKRCGKVKGRTCADGSVQRRYIPKEDSLSPMTSLQVLFATSAIHYMDN